MGYTIAACSESTRDQLKTRDCSHIDTKPYNKNDTR